MKSKLKRLGLKKSFGIIPSVVLDVLLPLRAGPGELAFCNFDRREPASHRPDDGKTVKKRVREGPGITIPPPPRESQL